MADPPPPSSPWLEEALAAARAQRREWEAAGHTYLSTACLHGQHDYCNTSIRDDGGTKVPACCKFCGAPCVCDTPGCHSAQPTEGGTDA